MKVFIAGSSGMLATDLVPVLEADHSVAVGQRPGFDVTDTASTRAAIEGFGPDVVINCAAYTSVDRAEHEEDEAFRVNSVATASIAAICRDSAIRLIHFSTDYVFDGRKNTPYNEDDATGPLNVYGKSKLKGEFRIRAVLDDFLIIRTSWLYGSSGTNFVKKIIARAGEEGPLRVVCDQVSTPTFTADLAKAVKELMESGATGLYHYANEGVASWYDFAHAVVGCMKDSGMEVRAGVVSPIMSGELNLAAARPAYTVLDKSRFKRRTGSSIAHWRDSLAGLFASGALDPPA